MANGHDNNGTINTIVKIFGVIGAAGVGTWIIRWLKLNTEAKLAINKQKHETDIEMHERKSKSDNLLIQEFKQLMEERENEFRAAREEFRAEKKEFMEENARLRRRMQVLQVDNEAMRVKLQAQEREISVLTHSGTRPVLGDRFDPVLITNGVGDICYCNETSSHFLGYPLEELYRMNVEEFVPKKSRGQFRENIERSIRHPPSRGMPFEYVIRDKTLIRDGTEVPTDIVVSLYPVDDKICRRYQIRRRYERATEDEGSSEQAEAYVPAHASGTSPAIIKAPVVEPEKIDAGEAPVPEKGDG